MPKFIIGGRGMAPLCIMFTGGKGGIPGMRPGWGGIMPGLGFDDGWTCGDSMGLCMGLDAGPRVLGGGGPIPGIIGFDRGLLGPPGWPEGRRKGGRICCII